MAVRSVIFDIIGKDSASPAFLRAAKSAETAAAGIDRSIAKIRKAGLGMQVVGQKLTKHFTLPFIAAAGVSVDQAVKFQKSMTLIQTAGGETARKAAAISVGIKKVATETGTSLDQLGEGIYTVAKAGSQKWSATGQLEVLKAAAQGAKNENVDLGVAVNALTSVMMSYHLKAKDAVKVEDQLVRGAGMAKTTMQEYAGSLATVVPIASAAHIKFAQVAGAIATLTQHGTSAQEATQELANTIRNLQAPNNVAVKAMQQLKIPVVDLEKNLGKRGLTGTIDLITNAIEKKMGPSGLVAVSAFKKSQSASADLSIELSKMPKHLADISKQFETGNLGYKQYYQDVKALGGAAFEMGKGFISTMAQAKGFNDLLKAGSPAAQTFAAYLKKVMGGATGLNTALQLGGENMKYFTTATDEVSRAAQKSGADVLGWAKTQDTLAVKLDKAKANLQVLAVEIGTALIPAVTKVVSWVSTAVNWFEGLSTGWKKFLGVAALTVAALGPALAIIGRVTKAVALMWAIGAGSARFVGGIAAAEMSLTSMQTRAYSAGLAVRRSFTNIGAAAKYAGAALAGISFGAAIGSITQGASTATKAVGALGSVAAGAAIGFSMGGPWGAALGGLTGGLSDVVTAFGLFGHAAKQQIKPTVEFTNAILADNDALGKNTRKLVENSLESKGLYDAGLKLGIGQRTLTNAMMGNRSAMATVAAAQLKVAHGYATTSKGVADMSQKQRDQIDANAKLSAGLGDLNTVLKVNKKAADNIAAADGKAGSAADKAAGSASRYAGALGKVPKHVNTKIGLQGVNLAMVELNRLLAKIPSGTFHFNVEADYRAKRASGLAAGGTVGGGVPGRDSVPAMLMPGEEVTPTRQANKYRPLLKAIAKDAVPRYATGGTVTRASGLITGISTARYNFSFSRFMQQLAAATSALQAAVKAGASKSEIASLNVRLSRAEREGNQQELHLGKSLRHQTGGLGALIGNLRNPASRGEVAGALKSIESTLRQAGVPKAYIKSLSDENKAIGEAVTKRNQAAAQLLKANQKLADARNKMKQDIASFRSATTGSFDITSAGVNSAGRVSKGSLRAAQVQDLTRVREFVTGIKKLASKRIFPPSYLRQLAGKGPDALPTVKALLSMSGTELKAFAHTEQQISHLAAGEAKVVGRRLDQGAVNRAKHEQQVWEKREHRREKHLEHQVDRVIAGIGHELHKLHLTAKLDAAGLQLIVAQGEKQAKSRRGGAK